MNLIQNNPYRTVGLLVGATAREQDRQIRRLKQFIEAEQDPQDDFSFPTLGSLHRTLDSVTEAASKLNLDSDKINAALFWFYNGNNIADEPAFEALKEGDEQTAQNIWHSLSQKQINNKTASAYFNLSSLYLFNAFWKKEINDNFLSESIRLKLIYLESDLWLEIKKIATDEIYKSSKKELQLLFLNQLQSEIEKSGSVTSNTFLDILTKQEFSAKEEFLKSFVQKPIEQIEQKIETAKNKRKASKSKAAKAGQELFTTTASDLIQLKSIVGTSDIKYTSIADKVANEILQCSIDYFNDNQDKDSSFDYAETAMKLAKKAKKIAIGNLTKDRVKDSINTLAEMKDRELSEAVQVLKSIKEAYENNERQVRQQVRIQEANLPWGQSINWSKVEELIRNSLDWNKVTQLIGEVIPQKNIEKIKNVNNPAKLNEYKTLVNFLLDKISYSYKNRLSYLRYWETPKTTSTPRPTTSTPRPTTSTPRPTTSTPRPTTSTPRPTTSTPRPTTSTSSSSSSDNEGGTNWGAWVIGIIVLIILIRACN